jgi:hypothetical protein
MRERHSKDVHTQHWYEDNKTACVHYVVPKQQTRVTRAVAGNKNHNKITTPQLQHNCSML